MPSFEPRAHPLSAAGRVGDTAEEDAPAPSRPPADQAPAVLRKPRREGMSEEGEWQHRSETIEPGEDWAVSPAEKGAETGPLLRVRNLNDRN